VILVLGGRELHPRESQIVGSSQLNRLAHFFPHQDYQEQTENIAEFGKKIIFLFYKTKSITNWESESFRRRYNYGSSTNKQIKIIRKPVFLAI